MRNVFRNLPSVNQLLESAPLKKMVGSVNHRVVVDGVRTFLDDLRDQINSTTEDVVIPTAHDLAEKIVNWLETEERPYLRPVINATGIILHTGLGRSPLAKAAIDAMTEVADGYASVEIDLVSGHRGQRVKSVERLLCEMTGAEAAAVVNNNAGATILALASLASGKEVIVSRGQLIEIGGSFRLPQVMECSGAKLHEVGTTNKTHPRDYEGAINEQTGALLRVHPSNFEVVGFTKSVSLKEMVRIGAAHDLPVIDDIGSGALVDFSKYGLNDEPVARQSIRDGADVILFSGDKLVGGPQCGIICGKKKWIEMISENPLMRALRVDKVTLAALAATLRLYRNLDQAELQIPLLRMLSMPIDNLKIRAEKIAGQIRHLDGIDSCEIIEEDSMLGGGSLPTQKIPSWCVAVTAKGQSIDQLASKLRNGNFAVIGHVHKDRLLLDMRTVSPAQDIDLATAFEDVCGGKNSSES